MGQEIPEWELKMGWKSCSETSVREYHYILRNVPEERDLIQEWCVAIFTKLKISKTTAYYLY
jgi:hypothetical protein